MMKTISDISAFASIIGFFIPYFANQSNSGPNNFQIFCLIAFVLFSILKFFLDWKNSPKKYSNEKDINKYMLKWISHIGRVVIFTRDMSWAHEGVIKGQLMDKAQKGELIICMPKINKLATDLQNSGARIVEYQNINYTPKSRFTIIHYGRSDAKVAIGKSYDKSHVIEEFSNGDHPLYYVAQDLVDILIKADEQGIKI